MSKILKILLTAIVLEGCVTRIFANGFSLSDQDAFATGRGEAFAATANNASAVYYNPAGMAQLEGDNFRGGLYSIYLYPGYSPPSSGTTYHSSEDYAFIPQIFLTHSFTNSPWSFGLGIYAPFGGNIDWPPDTGFRTVAIQGKLTYFTINPVVALQLAPNLSIGGGVTANYVKMSFEQGLRPTYQPPNINFYQFTGDGWSVGYNLGLLWKPIEQISLGATFRSSAEVNLKGHSEFEEVSAHVRNTTSPAQMDLTFPLEAVFGASYRPTTNWNVEFDASYTAWSSFEKTTIYQSGAFPLGASPDVAVTLDWQDSWMYEIGATRYFGKGWHVSAGYIYDENSVPNAYYSPLAADLDRHFVSVGIGREGKRFDFDLAYQLGYAPKHTVTGSTPSTNLGLSAGPHPADGTYSFISDAVIITMGIHF